MLWPLHTTYPIVVGVLYSLRMCNAFVQHDIVPLWSESADADDMLLFYSGQKRAIQLENLWEDKQNICFKFSMVLWSISHFYYTRYVTLLRWLMVVPWRAWLEYILYCVAVPLPIMLMDWKFVGRYRNKHTFRLVNSKKVFGYLSVF